MAVTHTHPTAVLNNEGDAIHADHMDSRGNEFGFDDHKQEYEAQSERRRRLVSEHTHEGVTELYDRASDSTRLLPDEEVNEMRRQSGGRTEDAFAEPADEPSADDQAEIERQDEEDDAATT